MRRDVMYMREEEEEVREKNHKKSKTEEVENE